MSQDLIQLLKQTARRITKAEQSEVNLRMFEQLGLGIDDVERMAISVGLEVDDLLLLDTHFSVGSEKTPICSVEDFNQRDDTLADISEHLRRLRSELHDTIRTLSLDNTLSTLNPMEQDLFEATESTSALPGKKIAAKTIHSYDSSARRALSTLVKLRLLKKVQGGYIRHMKSRDMSPSTD